MRMLEVLTVPFMAATGALISALPLPSLALATARPVAAATTAETPSRSAPVNAPKAGSVPAAASTAADAVPTAEGAAAASPSSPNAESSTAAADAQPAKPKALPPTLIVRINLASQTMVVQAGNKTIHTWKVSSGAPGYATPAGTFKPGWMAKMWYSRQYDDAPMPHSVFFNGGIAVHATTSLHNLGRPASHGCVRLAPGNAEKFYGLVTRHGMARTRIVVYGSQPFSAQSDRIAKLNKRNEWNRPAVARAPVPATLWYRMPPSYGSSYAPYGDVYTRSTSATARSSRSDTSQRRSVASRGGNTRVR